MYDDTTLTQKMRAWCDPDYDNMFGPGRRVRQYDLTLHKWYEFTVYGPTGPQSRRTPTPVADALAPEKLWRPAPAPRPPMNNSSIQLWQQIRSLLQEHGTMDAYEIAWALGIDPVRVRQFATEHGQRVGMVACGKNGRHKLYRLEEKGDE